MPAVVHVCNRNISLAVKADLLFSSLILQPPIRKNCVEIRTD